jgi:iron complex outermembrane receptor protein
MYYKLQGYSADPHLKPEEMQALEAGLQYHSPTLQAKLSAYYHHGRNMIDWIMDTNQGEQAQWQSVNHTKINAYGFEAYVAYQSKIGMLDASYSYIDQDKDIEPGIVSQYALEYLRHKFVAGFQTKEWQGLSIRLNFRWQDRVGSYTTFDGCLLNYRPYGLLDARAQWKTRRFTLYSEVNNLLNNRSYVDFGNVQQPGAWFITGITLRM